VSQLIGSLTYGVAQETLRPAADFVAPSSPSSFDIPLPSVGEGILENSSTTAGSEFPAAKSTPTARIDRQAVVEASQEAQKTTFEALVILIVRFLKCRIKTTFSYPSHC
jgi:hypothetical protein